MNDAIPTVQPPTPQPFATWNPARGIWETAQLDLCGQPAPYSAIWPTSGWMHNGSVYPLRRSARRIRGFASSCLPITLFRTPLASDSARGGETLDQVKARRGTIALSHQVIDLVKRGRRTTPEATFAVISKFFQIGDATPGLSPNGRAS